MRMIYDTGFAVTVAGERYSTQSSRGDEFEQRVEEALRRHTTTYSTCGLEDE